MIDLVTAGEAYEDFIFYGLRSLPAPGEELKTDAFARTAGGGAVITAIAAARLGLRCAIVSGLSRATARLLRRERVAVRNILRRDEPAALTVALSTGSDRRFVTFNGANAHLPRRMLPVVRAISARHVHFAFCPDRCRDWIRVVGALRRRSITTSFDFGWNPALVRDPDFRGLAQAVDYLFLNRGETMLYARRRSLAAALDRWRRSPGVVVIRMGARGARIVGAGMDVRAAAPPVRAIDTTGAGDAFNAGFIAARLRGRDFGAALGLANRIGALSTRHPGGIAGLPRAKALT